MPEELQARRFLISGLVQGVGYRFFAQRVAQRLRVAGYAKNRHDGRVEIYAIGSVTQLRALRDELRRGPRMAEVTEVQEQEAAVDHRFAEDFSIGYED